MPGHRRAHAPVQHQRPAHGARSPAPTPFGLGGMGAPSVDLRQGNAGLQASLGLEGGGGLDALASDWIGELLGTVGTEDRAEGPWAGVQAKVDTLAQRTDAGQATPPVPEHHGGAHGLDISRQGRADLDRLGAAASRPWYSRPRGKCYAAVAGYGPGSYMNRAGGRWKQLADRIPGSHAMWAVSFAHWLQETRHGQRAARDLGFEILESDGKTRLNDFLMARPELKGAIVVVPYGQQGTASREFDAARAYGDAKWGAGVGDISVVTEISGRGVTYVADAENPHDNATMWWIVYPR